MTRFARYHCPLCGYVYDEQLGDPHEGFRPGTSWTQVPDDWACPDCAVRCKPDFVHANGQEVDSLLCPPGAHHVGA